MGDIGLNFAYTHALVCGGGESRIYAITRAFQGLLFYVCTHGPRDEEIVCKILRHDYSHAAAYFHFRADLLLCASNYTKPRYEPSRSAYVSYKPVNVVRIK